MAWESVHEGITQETQETQRRLQRPQQFQPYLHAPMLPQPPYPQAVVQPDRSEMPAQLDRARVSFNARKGRKAALPAWMLVAAIVMLLIAGGTGVFTLVAHTPASYAGKSNGTGRTISGSTRTQNRPVGTPGSTPITNTHSVNTSKDTTTTLACTASGSHTGSFTFSGAVTGTIALSAFEACTSATNTCYITCFSASPSKNGGQTYFGKAQGKIDGVTYQFEFLINPYSGPGTYTSTGNTSVVLIRNNYEWESYGTASNHISIVVSASGKTGTIRATISMMSPQFDPTNVVVVTGNWSE
jgi:hypothetical protein